MDFFQEIEARGLIKDVTDREMLRQRIASGPVGIYYGCDPSADSLQVGNLIGLLVIRRFADAGHNPVALAGGATGMIGDPSGRSSERNFLDAATLASNLSRISEQIARISKVPVVDNRTWTEGLSWLSFLRDVGEHAAVNRMVARESVKARLEHGMTFTEFSYQLLQANDFLHLFQNHDVEVQIGGSDQWGNILAGVELIRKATGATAHAFTWPLLLRSDGEKFGKSAGGAVWLAEDRTEPDTFYDYWMNVPDHDVERFLLQLTLLSIEECRAVAAQHAASPATRVGQRRLALEITTIVHGPEVALECQDRA